MKRKTLLIFASLLVPAAASPAPQPARVMRDSVTHEQLSLSLRTAGQNDPMRKLAMSRGPDPSKVNQPEDLLSQSDMISFGGYATLVPKRAIIHIPAALAGRIKMEPGHKIQSWAEFYSLNRGWISTVEVNRPQAEGNLPLPEEISTRIGKSSNLTVATYKGAPISMLPQKVAVETPAETTQP